MNRTTALLLAATLTGSTGCASAFLGGGKLTSHDLAQGASRSFRLGTCVDLATQQPTVSPPATYHLVDHEGKPALFERSPDGSGSVITNSWHAADGMHYLAWVLRSGWEFVVPDEAGAQGVRKVYQVLEKTKADGVTRPANTPSAQCALLPTG